MRSLALIPVCLALVSAACGADPAANGSSAASPFVDAGAPLQAGAANPGGTGAVPGVNSGSTAPITSGAPSNTGPTTCESHVVDGTLAVPDMLIVLDRSGSMNPDNNDDGTDRWGGSCEALIDVTQAFDHQVRFGLMTFPGVQAGGGGGDNQCAPGKLDVPIALNSGPTIATTLGAMDANGRTPTAAALEAALPILSVPVGPDEVAGAKFVLLVTDGDPNCGMPNGGRGNARDDVARMATVRAIEALAAAGIKTFVVGYQTAGTDFVDQLDRMAAAGGTGATQHSSVASGADLNATLSKIASKLVSCSYQLKSAVADPTKVLVTVAGRPRNLNAAADGWSLGTDHRTVTLTGRACMEVETGSVFSVQVTCEPVPIY